MTLEKSCPFLGVQRDWSELVLIALKPGSRESAQWLWEVEMGRKRGFPVSSTYSNLGKSIFICQLFYILGLPRSFYLKKGLHGLNFFQNHLARRSLAYEILIL